MDTGQIIAERYRIDRVIGHGGMGDIYLATDLTEQRDVAIKRLKRELIQSDRGVVERFQREGDIQKRLSHPATVQVFDTLSENDEHFIVMEYVNGGTLSSLLKKQDGRRLPFNQVLEIGWHLSEALSEAHRKGIVHRDLKPANILMTSGGKPRLTDFGAARLDDAHRLTVTGMVIGTYAYMSPEACRGEKVDGRADVWSFGVMLFELLTGKRPFGQDNPMQLMLAIMREPPADIQRLNPEVPDSLADLIYRMLAKDVNRRIPSMAIISAELQHMIDGGAGNTYQTSVHTQFIMPGEILGSREPSLPEYGPLMGRVDELRQLIQMMMDPTQRLITLQGSGGIGKTHLAVEAAREVSPHFEDGAFFVDLTDIKDPENITASIAAAVKFQFFGNESPIQQLSNYFSNKNLLLLIDNFEQVIKGADLVTTLLKDSPEIQILLTSRERANLRDEQAITLDGLPADQAYDLFIQTARRLRSDYSPSQDGQQAIRKICDLVDGSPLAIELAAGWVNMLTPAEIVEEMAEGMDFLESNLRDVPERHRSIRAISENSWKLLNDSERDALRRLSVFRGGFRREAVRKVVGASLLTLNSLIDKSLLRRSPESGLYSMQELLRWFASEKLEEVPSERQKVKESHARYYLDQLRKISPELIGGGQIEALTRIERRLGNIKAALETAIEIRDDELIEIWIDGMYLFYLMRGRQQEGAEAIRRATFASAMGAKNGLVQVKMMSRLGAYQRFIGEFDSAQAILQESLNLARDLKVNEEVAYALYQLGAVRPDVEESPEMWQEAFNIAESINHGWLMAEISNWMAFYNFQIADIDQAIRWLERGMEERRRLQDSYGLAIILTNLGFIQMQMGDLSKAKDFLTEALEINMLIGNFNGIAAAWNNIAYIALSEGEIDEAQEAANQALVYYDQSGNRRGRGEALGNLIGVAIHNQDYTTAEDVCLQCIRLFRSMNLPINVFIREQGRIALARKRYDQARAYFLEALETPSNASHKLSVLAGFGELLTKCGQEEVGRQLLKFVIENGGTEPEVRRRAEAAWDGSIVAPEIVGAPSSLNDWITYISNISESVPA
ncbi:MAG: protein kinase [Chloroflexota bacterium]